MSYEDWGDAFQELFDTLPGMADALQYDDQFNERTAETLFEVGFTMHSSEYEALGYSPDQVQAIRDEFFDYMDIDPAEFDWEEWREAMGYE